MMAGQGGYVDDPFNAAAKFTKEREALEERRRQRSKLSRDQQRARDMAAQTIRRAQESQGFGGFDPNMIFASLMGAAAPGVAKVEESELSRRRRERRERQAARTGSSSGSGSAGGARSTLEELMGLNESQGTVPLERALVPVVAYRMPGPQHAADQA